MLLERARKHSSREGVTAAEQNDERLVARGYLHDPSMGKVAEAVYIEGDTAPAAA